jgi:hypothetical protein
LEGVYGGVGGGLQVIVGGLEVVVGDLELMETKEEA